MPPIDEIARRASLRYPLPPVVHRLLTLNEPGVDDAPEAATLLAEIVARDEDLARRLRVVSTAPGPWRPRTANLTLERGARALGFRRVHTAALIVATCASLPVQTAVVDYLRFWRYSAAVTYMTASVAYEDRLDHREFGAAVGLFHDVGRLVAEEFDPAGIRRIHDRQVEGDRSWLAVERAELGFTVFELTVALLREWGLPETVIATAQALRDDDPPPLTLALRDSILTARALDFATSTGRLTRAVPRAVDVVERYFGGPGGLAERIDSLLGAAMVASSGPPEE